MLRLITADRVLPGPEGECVEDGAVLVDGTRVVAVGPCREVLALAPEGTGRQHFDGATVLPGLVNAHVHLAFDETSADAAALVETVRTASDESLRHAMGRRALAALRSGVTTLRDCGDRGGLAARVRDDITAGAARGPRIVATGPPLTVPGGHCWFLGAAAGSGPRHPRSGAAQRGTRRRHDQGDGLRRADHAALPAELDLPVRPRSAAGPGGGGGAAGVAGRRARPRHRGDPGRRGRGCAHHRALLLDDGSAQRAA